MPQPGFFDLDERYAKLNERDPLVKLNQIIDWEAFREPLSVLRNKPRKSQAGRKPYDVVLMFKILVLQHLYNVSDGDIEYQIRDRGRSFDNSGLEKRCEFDLSRCSYESEHSNSAHCQSVESR